MAKLLVGQVFGLALVGLTGLSQPVMAQCVGSGVSTVCVDPYSGKVWTGMDRYFTPDMGSQSGSGGIAKYPNATSGSGSSKDPPASPAAPGVTGVLQPSAQSGNAEVLTPKSGSTGATVLHNDDNAGAVVCGATTSC